MRAISWLEQNIALANIDTRADAQFALAQALWMAHADRKRAIQLAIEARDHFRDIGDRRRFEVISAWITERAPIASGAVGE